MLILVLLILSGCNYFSDTFSTDEEGGIQIQIEEGTVKKDTVIPEIDTVCRFHDGILIYQSIINKKTETVEISRYYPTGRVQAKLTKKKGELDGAYYIYYPDGEIEEIRNYRDGMLDGISKNIFYYVDSLGRQIRNETDAFYKQDTLVRENLVEEKIIEE